MIVAARASWTGWLAKSKTVMSKIDSNREYLKIRTFAGLGDMISSSSQINSWFRYTGQDMDLFCGLGLTRIITVSYHCKVNMIQKQEEPDSFSQVFEG